MMEVIHRYFLSNLQKMYVIVINTVIDWWQSAKSGFLVRLRRRFCLFVCVRDAFRNLLFEEHELTGEEAKLDPSPAWVTSRGVSNPKNLKFWHHFIPKRAWKRLWWPESRRTVAPRTPVRSWPHVMSCCVSASSVRSVRSPPAGSRLVVQACFGRVLVIIATWNLRAN